MEVDNRLILLIQTQVRILVTSADVLHGFAVPSLGVKVDAVPGRLNQTSFFIKRPGVFYGQCSELCGANHSFMPIVVEGVSIVKYVHLSADSAVMGPYLACNLIGRVLDFNLRGTGSNPVTPGAAVRGSNLSVSVYMKTDSFVFFLFSILVNFILPKLQGQAIIRDLFNFIERGKKIKLNTTLLV